MASLSRRRIDELVTRINSSQTSNEKGEALEDMICYMFGKIPGVSYHARDVRNVSQDQEIDVAFWNTKKDRGLYFLEYTVLVECKNWTSAVGSPEVSWFGDKLRDRGLAYGILVAANGVTGNSASLTQAHRTISNALHEGRKIIVITLAELISLRDTGSLVKLIERKICQLMVAETSLLA